LPSEAIPIDVACPRCEEAGCDDCDGAGTFSLTSCPKKMLDWELVQVIRYAELFGKGLPPVAGGSLDQSAWFINLHSFYEYESSLAEAEQYKTDGNSIR